MRSNRTLKYFVYFIKHLPNLTGKEKEVLVKRIRYITLETIGNSFKLTEARIRQIEKIAIRKIRRKSQQLALFKR